MNGGRVGNNNVRGTSRRSEKPDEHSFSNMYGAPSRARSSRPPADPRTTRTNGRGRESYPYNENYRYQRNNKGRPRAEYGRGFGSSDSVRSNGYGYGYDRSTYAAYGRGANSPSRNQIEYERRRIEYERRRREEARKIAEYKRRRAAMERERRRIEQKLKAERKRRRKKARKIFRGRAIICLCIFILLFSLTAGAFSIHFFMSPDEKSGSKIEYLYGGVKKRETDGSLAVINGETYLCFNDIADYLSMAVMGDKNGMKFIFHRDEESVSDNTSEESLEFKVGSRTADVCGKQVLMNGECVLRDESAWIPVSFAKEYLRGLSITEEKNTVSVARVVDEEKTVGKDIVYREASLSLRGDDALPSISGEEKGNKVTFSTDMSDYEKYMAPEDDSEYLVLVSSSSPLDKTYEPGDLTGIANTRQDGRETQRLRLYAAKALEAMFIEMQAAGYGDVTVTSGYRSYDYQSELFESYVNNEISADSTLTREAAEAKVALYSSPPGASEHQSGLCADMHNLSSADASFSETEAYAWLRENAWKFGFILRYPENKTDATGITFEPWHWRYVGRDAALEIYGSAICLEEYAAAKANNE